MVKCPICGADFTSPPLGPPPLPLENAPIKPLVQLSSTQVSAIAACATAVCVAVLTGAYLHSQYRAHLEVVAAKAREETKARYREICKEIERVRVIRAEVRDECARLKPSNVREENGLMYELYQKRGISAGTLSYLETERRRLAKELGIKDE